MQYAWNCGCCGKQFDSLPEGYAFKAPDQWAAIPEPERATRGMCDTDVCRIRGVGVFVRGCIEVPVIGTDEPFVWGVWMSVSEQSMSRIVELWTAARIDNEPPKFGWLSNSISIYPPTLNLKTNLHLRGGGLRPAIELEPTDHPLSLEQRRGMTPERVLEIAGALALHH